MANPTAEDIAAIKALGPLTPAEIAALSPEDKKIFDEIEAERTAMPAKKAADKVIRDKAAAEGRPLTFQELTQLNYRTTQDDIQSIGAGPQGTAYNPFPTGQAAEKGPFNQEALRFGIYQNYLRQWNYGKRDYVTKQLLEPGAEPMTFEEFKPAFDAIGGDQNEIGKLAGFSKGQGELAVRTGGVQVPGMNLLLDPRYGATVDSVLTAAGYSPGSTGAGDGTGGQYTTMGSSTGGQYTTQGMNRALSTPEGRERKSAYDLLFQEFDRYGLGSLVEPLKGLITENVSPSEFVIKLRQTDAYKKRFAGNAARVAKGLAAISEAEYIGLEDQYQNIMRNYGLPDTYWAKDSMGTQEGFTNFIGNDVSAAELESRIMNAQKRVINANPEVSAALKQFYPEITNGDILAYTLDPTKGLDVINRKITAAEIGGAALAQGLQTGMTRAEELASYGVTKDQAMQGYQTAAQIVPRGGQLAAMYGESPYDQTTAEQEIFGLAGSAEAAAKRKKLVGLETAAFSGQSGLTQGALGRERAGGF